MAFGRIDFCGALWQSKGIRWLLSQKPLSASLSLVGGKEKEPAKAPPMPRRPVPAWTPRKEEVPSSVPKSLSFPHERTLPKKIPPAEWAEDWKKVRASAKKGLVVWTYEELGGDLLGIESEGLAERRLFLTKVLQYPPVFPIGTHTFWPYALFRNGVYEPDAGIFWTGVHELQAKIVVVLGAKAGQLLLGRETPFTRLVVQGVQGIVFEDIAELKQDSARFEQMQSFLRSVLARSGIFPATKGG